jgi:hypothetical protein
MSIIAIISGHHNGAAPKKRSEKCPPLANTPPLANNGYEVKRTALALGASA